MCDVRPFCGLRYNLQRVTDPTAVIAPPYDVVPPQERSRYQRKSPYNIIRLESSEELPGDSANNNRYTRAAATLNDWIMQGILVREQQPAFYIVEHRFPSEGHYTSRWGVVARVRLEEFETGRIRPHERTASGPQVDRLALLQACRANISPIMGLVRTENGEMLAMARDLSDREPETSAMDDSGVTYNLWAATGERATGEITRFMADRTIYIADGHHRYKTALAYKREQQRASAVHTGDEPYNFLMMSLMDSKDPGILMLPTHRLVRGLDADRSARLHDVLSACFEVEEPATASSGSPEAVREHVRALEERARARTALGVYGLEGQRFQLLTLRQGVDLRGAMTEEEVGLWGQVDVVLLQRLVLEEGLGLAGPDEEVAGLQYTLDAREAVRRVDSGECQVAFFLSQASVSTIFHTADAGKLLPRKSTHFYPKTPAGMVVNPVWNGV